MASLIINTISSYPELRLSHDGIKYIHIIQKNLIPIQKFSSMFDKCLAESGILPKLIDHIVIIVGPGSYTGIRVGIAFVLGISLSLNIKYYSIKFI